MAPAACSSVGPVAGPMGAGAPRGLSRARVRLGTTLVALVLGPLLALGLGAPPPQARGVPGRSEVAGRDLAGLLAGGPAHPVTATLPSFGPVMGYAPAAVRLAGSDLPRWVKPSGACSSPLGQTPFGFGAVCQAHDFGYDLLRYADRTGAPAPPGARRLLDSRFDHDLHAHCAATRHGLGRLACDGFAALYAGATKLGSRVQRYGTP
jgi:hypothetical protein